MICPYCGADIKDYAPVCRMCGNDINREEQYAGFIEKGDRAMAFSPGSAAVNYKRALEFIGDRAEGYIKLGNALDKKNDPGAAAAYIKAVQADFNCDQAHNLLISFFERAGKLDDIRDWYERNRNTGNSALVDKYAGIIDGMIRFKSEHPFIIPADRSDGLMPAIFSSFREYPMMNVVIGLMAVFGAAAGAGIYFFHLDMSYVILFSVFVFVTGLAVSVFIRRAGKKQKKHGDSLEKILSEFKGRNNPGG